MYWNVSLKYALPAHAYPDIPNANTLVFHITYIVKSAKQNIVKFVFNTIIQGSRKKLIKIYQIVKL